MRENNVTIFMEEVSVEHIKQEYRQRVNDRGGRAGDKINPLLCQCL